MKSKVDPELYVTRKEYDDACHYRDMYRNLYESSKMTNERLAISLHDANERISVLSKKLHELRKEKDSIMTKLVNAYGVILQIK